MLTALICLVLAIIFVNFFKKWADKNWTNEAPTSNNNIIERHQKMLDTDFRNSSVYRDFKSAHGEPGIPKP
jgi:hypothetical protein